MQRPEWDGEPFQLRQKYEFFQASLAQCARPQPYKMYLVDDPRVLAYNSSCTADFNFQKCKSYLGTCEPNGDARALFISESKLEVPIIRGSCVATTPDFQFFFSLDAAS